ncbi:hypothetical protein AB0M95_08780 [Sphaerisporangium sp. NPDC051017]|uniref:hypothetical protein n=1 Tax=Sphaerisporangium sp. NPDC051017 TaxID=3154636 RepID=UPI00341EE958
MKARRARPAWARPAGTGTLPPETPSADARPPGLRRRGGLLRERDFRLLWVGETAGAFGSSVTTVALPLVAITVLQANALVVGVPAAEIGCLPFVLLIPAAFPGWGLAPAMGGGFVIAAGVVAGNVIKGSFRQVYTPRHLLGRASVSMQFVNLGTIPLGALLGGALGDSLGVRPAMWIMTGGMTLTGFILLAGPLKRDRDLPDAPAVS